MRNDLLTLISLSWVVGAGFALADTDPWVGLYQGVDPKDGSINYLSLTPGAEGQYALHISVTEHVKCGAPAVILADAYVQDGQLIREDTYLRCASGDPVRHLDTSYGLDADNRIIILTAPFDGRVIHYHRISR